MARFLKYFKINVFFIVFFVFFIVKFGFLFSFWYFLATIIHEYGHLYCAKKCGYVAKKFALSPFGISFTMDELLENKDEFLIALFGPLVNIISSLIMMGIWWVIPSFYNVSCDFVFISLTMASINLLPLYPLDGGRLFKGLFYKLKIETLNIFLKVFCIITIFSLVITFFIVLPIVNYSLLVFALFLCIGLFDYGKELELEKYTIFTKKLKNFSNVKFIYVSYETRLMSMLNATATKYFVVFVIEKNGKVKILTENMLKGLVEKNNVSASIGDIIFEPRKFLK